MDFQSAMETFAEAWVAANTQTPLTEAAAAEAQALAYSSRPTDAHDMKAEKDSDDYEFDLPRGSNLRSPHQEPHMGKGGSGRTPSTSAKSIPVHCIVEQVPSPQNCDQSGEPLQPTVELDSYAIIPSATLFSELVRTGLIKLGYPPSETIGAKGAIHMKNWKPLTFDMITDSPDATVGEILGELTTVATLRIRLYSRVRVSTAHDVKEKLLQLLLTQSQSLLVSAGCPIDENLLSLISKGLLPYEISEETRKRFDMWYMQQVMHHRQQHQPPPPTPPCSRSEASTAVTVTTPTLTASNTAPTSAYHHHAAVQKTRMRTSFDPELELPKLHRWFAENQHPTRQLIQQYVRELNALESRKGRKPLDVNNVVYWFKNARAAHKRAELRQLNGGGVGVVGLGGPLGNASPLHDTASSDNGLPSGDAYNGDNQDSDASGGHSTNNYPLMPLNLSDCRRTPDQTLNPSSKHDSPDLPNGSYSESLRKSEDSPSPPPRTAGGQSPPSEGGVSVKQEPPDDTNEPRSPEMSDDEDLDVAMDTSESTSNNNNNNNNNTTTTYDPKGSPTPLLPPLHPPSAELARSMLYMASYLPSAIASLEERRKRNRTFIDPVTEVPRLEQWFSLNTHPSHNLILKYTEELNKMPYRQKFPKLEPKNVQFWFKNRRAKCKRLKLTIAQTDLLPNQTDLVPNQADLRPNQTAL